MPECGGKAERIVRAGRAAGDPRRSEGEEEARAVERSGRDGRRVAEREWDAPADWAVESVMLDVDPRVISAEPDILRPRRLVRK
jgi:hypothetical protein